MYIMVLLNAAKSARLQNLIVNRNNTCGGVKKAGLAPRVGWFLASNVHFRRAPQSLPRFCTEEIKETATIPTTIPPTSYFYGERDQWIVASSSTNYITWGDTGIPDNLNMTISFWIQPNGLYGQSSGINFSTLDYTYPTQSFVNLIHLSEDGLNNTQIYVDDTTNGTTNTVQVSRSPAIFIGSQSTNVNPNYIDNGNYGTILNTGFQGNIGTPVFLTFAFSTTNGDTSLYPSGTCNYYVNGVLVNSKTEIAVQRATSTAQLFIGNDYNPWTGQTAPTADIRNMTFVNKVFDADDVTTLYDNEYKKLYPPSL